MYVSCHNFNVKIGAHLIYIVCREINAFPELSVIIGKNHYVTAVHVLT